MNSAREPEMRRLTRRLIGLRGALVALGLVAALAAACSGGGDGEGSPTAQPTAEGSPTVQPTGQATTSTACQALVSLERYRYVSNVTLESPEEPVPPTEGQPTPVATLTRPFQGRFYFEYRIDGSLVAPDRVDASISSGGGSPFDLIAIGDQRWVSVEGAWREVGIEYAVPYQPVDVCNGIFPELNLEEGQGSQETVNDVPARHYAFQGIPSGQAMALIFGPQSDVAVLIPTMDVEVWVAEKDGWPVRMDVHGSGLYGDGRELRADVHIELRDVNNKDIKVEPPL